MKTLMVTGATSGLGLEIATLASKTCKVIACGRNMDVLVKLQKKHGCSVLQGNINDWGTPAPPTINRMAGVIANSNVDVLVACAGEYQKHSLSEIRDCEIAGIITTNLVSTILLLRRALAEMLKRKKGTICVINSLAGKVASDTYESIYCASKFGLRGFVESVRQDYARAGIRIFSVYPGAMQTPMMFHRGDYGSLPKPRVVARVIVDLCLKYRDVRLDDVEIRRTTY